jgi:hypothetical protein
VRRLCGERVELFGRSAALFPSLHYHLFFPDHVHEWHCQVVGDDLVTGQQQALSG